MCLGFTFYKCAIYCRLISVWLLSLHLLFLRFIHIVADSYHSLILIAVLYSSVWLYYNLFSIHFSLTFKYISNLESLWIFLYMFWSTYITLLCVCLGEKLFGYRINRFFIFRRYCQTISQSVWEFQLFYTPQTLDILWNFCVLIYFSHACKYNGISVWLYLHFPDA